MKTITLELPAFLASYFINGDASGLEDSEIRKADSMLEREGVRIIDVARDESGEASEQFFGAWHFPEFSETGGDLLEYVAEFLPVSANAFAYARRFGRSDGSVRPARDANEHRLETLAPSRDKPRARANHATRKRRDSLCRAVQTPRRRNAGGHD